MDYWKVVCSQSWKLYWGYSAEELTPSSDPWGSFFYQFDDCSIVNLPPLFLGQIGSGILKWDFTPFTGVNRVRSWALAEISPWGIGVPVFLLYVPAEPDSILVGLSLGCHRILLSFEQTFSLRSRIAIACFSAVLGWTYFFSEGVWYLYDLVAR